MPTPAADLSVDTGLVRMLLAEQCPDLADLPLRIAANGWDNAVFRLGDDLAVRVPRRVAAGRLVRHEQQVLPAIAARVPVAVPVPVRVGVPSARFPFHFSVVRWFEGRTAAAADLRDERLARALGDFLLALHEPADGAPPNPVRGVPLRHRTADMEERLRTLASAALDARWAAALEVPAWDGPPLWLHGDLHPANLIVRGGRLAAVIDFGDVTGGDPATDLAAGWLVFGPDARRAFRDTVRPDPATWARARGWAIVLGTAMVTTAEPGSTIHAIGSRALAEAVAD